MPLCTRQHGAANATVCFRAAPQSVRLSTERRRRALRSVRAIRRPRSRSTLNPDRPRNLSTSPPHACSAAVRRPTQQRLIEACVAAMPGGLVWRAVPLASDRVGPMRQLVRPRRDETARRVLSRGERRRAPAPASYMDVRLSVAVSLRRIPHRPALARARTRTPKHVLKRTSWLARRRVHRVGRALCGPNDRTSEIV